VEQYLSKAMTREEDRLPAQSGITQRYQRVRKGRYLAGLWEDNLVKGLCWKEYTRAGQHASTCLTHSWSWCSVLTKTGWRTAERLWGVDVDVEEARLHTIHHDPTGAVCSGSLRVAGVVLKGQAR
jgi:hypothetical protein